jgi:hypothetical protein
VLPGYESFEPIVCMDAIELSPCKLSEKISRSERKLRDIARAEDMLQSLLSADEDVCFLVLLGLQQSVFLF